MMKRTVPVRLLKNAFFEEIKAAEEVCADKDQLLKILGHGRAKAGMLEGDLSAGELEIGQIAGLVHDIPTVQALVARLMEEYRTVSSTFPVFPKA